MKLAWAGSRQVLEKGEGGFKPLQCDGGGGFLLNLDPCHQASLNRLLDPLGVHDCSLAAVKEKPACGSKAVLFLFLCGFPQAWGH